MSIDLLATRLPRQPFDQLEFRSKLPFHLRAGDGRIALTDDGAGADLTTITDRTGRVGTFTRGSVSGLVVSSNGKLVQSFTNFPNVEYWDHDADGVYETAGIRMDVARTNLITSQDISAWTDHNTPVVTAVSGPYAGVSGYSIEDNNATDYEAKYRVVAFTGNAVKVIALCVRKVTAALSLIELYDATGAADRLYAVVTWSGTDPGTPAMTVGTYLGKRQLADDWWELYFQTTSVTATNTHQLWLSGCDTAVAATIGTTSYALPGAWDAPFPGSLQTASQVTNKDDLRFTFPFLVQPLSLYLKFTEIGQRYSAANGVYASLGLGTNAATDPRLRIIVGGGGAGYAVGWDPGSDVTATLAALPSIGQSVELLVTLAAAGFATITQSIAGAATTSAATSTQALPTAPTYWGGSQANARLVIGDHGNSGDSPAALSLHVCKVDWGVKTMDQMRRAA